ncbi:MAG: hypothetical protein RBR47_04110 [Bacteroidales bacterium]|jgi:hypothetical protein|nr:hypothetical protein [Bacteroidales bacterium]MDD3526906.1 hypothetical protein [Bacteroidales bacterium]MDD4742443.1 hypothetical protein [Bacteroidales bacterium]MDY0334121.1 hypothetical protein [Bacteroidales bacterium]
MLHFKYLMFLAFVLAMFTTSRSQTLSPKADLLLPDYVKLQYAGGIGFMSAGVGYTFIKDRLDVTFFYGYIPAQLHTKTLHSVSLQFTAKLIKIPLSDKYQLLPFNFGWFIHHTMGNEYWIKLPAHYPSQYYWWSPGRTAGFFVGGELKTPWLRSKVPASGIALYARIGTRGLYLATKVGNSTLPVSEIIELGFGIALYR